MRRQRRPGATLVEAILSLGLVALCLLVMGALFAASHRARGRAEVAGERVRALQRSLDMVEGELRQASALVSLEPEEVTFRRPRPAAEADARDLVEVSYRFSEGQLSRSAEDGAPAIVVSGLRELSLAGGDPWIELRVVAGDGTAVTRWIRPPLSELPEDRR